MTIATLLGTYRTTSSPPPCYYESPGQTRRILVQSTGKWREQSKGERDAGLPSIINKLTFPWFKCHICGLCIGPHYETKHLYLYPVCNQLVNNHKKHKAEFWKYGILRICDGCATHKSIELPDWLCVMNPYCWLTTVLLCQDGEEPVYADPKNMEQSIRIRIATAQHVDACEYYLFLLFLFSCDISIRDFFAPRTSEGAWKNDPVTVREKRQPIFSGWRDDFVAAAAFPLLSCVEDPGISGFAL